MLTEHAPNAPNLARSTSRTSSAQRVARRLRRGAAQRRREAEPGRSGARGAAIRSSATSSRPSRQFEAFLASGAIGRESKAEMLQNGLRRPGQRAVPQLPAWCSTITSGSTCCGRSPRAYRDLHDQRARRVARAGPHGRAAARRPARAPGAGAARDASTWSRSWKRRSIPTCWAAWSCGSATGSYDASVRTQLDTIRNQLIERSSHEIQSRRDRFSSAGGDRAVPRRSSKRREWAACSRSATASPASTACPASWPARWSSSPEPASSGVAFNLEENSVGVVILGDYLEIEEGDEVRTHRRAAAACRSATP